MSASSEYARTLASLSGDYQDRRSRLAQQQAEIAAQTARQRGALIGGTLASLGQIPGQIMQQREHDQDRDLKRQQIQAGIETERTQQAHIQQQMAAGPKPPDPLDVQKANVEKLKLGAQILKSATPENWSLVKEFLVNSITGPDTANQYPDTFDPEFVKVHSAIAEEGAQKAAEYFERDPSKDIVNRVTGEVTRAGVPKPATIPNDPNPTEASLALKAAGGDTMSAKALNILRQQHPGQSGAASPVPTLGASIPDVPPGQTNDAFLASLPENVSGKVKALVEGRLALPTRFAKGDTYWQGLLDAAVKYDPTFDAANYNARNKARMDLTSPSGTGGKTINSLNTALQHAGKLSDLIEKLDNYESPLANAVVNPIRKATGHTEVTNFNAVAPQLMKEIERAWRGTGGSTADIQSLIASIGQNLGKQQQREALAAFVDLVNGKLDATQQQRDNIMGAAASGIPILFEQNKPIIDKIHQRASGASDSSSTADKVGDVKTFPNGKKGRWDGQGWELVQ